MGEAAKRGIGKDRNQIPDMSYWQAGNSGSYSWYVSPDGTIIQYGISAAGNIGTPNIVTLPIAFPAANFRVIASYDNARSGVTSMISFAATITANDKFNFMCSQIQGGNAAYGYWIAIGH